MNRLDRHVARVRGRLTLARFLRLLGNAVAVFFMVVLLVVLVDRFVWVELPRQMVWFWAGGSAAVVSAGFLAVRWRPSLHHAAILIDDKLGLNEKFSTALYARMQGNGVDPFEMAAAADAEQTAEHVSLHRKFPIAFPVSGFYAIGAALVVFLIAHFLPRIDLFDRHAKQALAQRQVAERVAAEQAAQKTLASVSALPAAVQAQQKVELARKDLQRVLDQNQADPTVMKLTAMKAQEEAESARREEIKTNQQYSQAMTDKAVFNSLNPTSDDQGPVADASKDMAAGDFSKAADELKSLPDKFNRMKPEDQNKTTDDMKSVADQLQKMANDPAAMQSPQQQLQQHGATTQQSQQIAQAAQEAARGNVMAQQKLQQLQKQLNGGKTPLQQQQIQKATQQMQSVAQSQAKAQQMARAAQQMVKGMQQAQGNRQGGSQAGQQQANAKAGNSDIPGPMQGGQTPSGKQGGTEPANSSKPGGQQPGGDQPGQGQGGNGQMQQAGQQMAKTMGEMDQTQKGAEEIASGEQPGDQAGNNPASSGPKSGGSKPGGGQGQQKSGSNGQGTGGVGATGKVAIDQQQLTQFTSNPEMDPTQNIEGGKVLSKTYVKADPIIGKSTIQLSPAAKSAVKESTDDASEDTVPREAQKAVKDYFDTVQGGN